MLYFQRYGVFATLRKVLPNLSNHQDAIKVAFTLPISGRTPEHRGNGLKFVDREVKRISLYRLFFFSDTGFYRIEAGVASNGTGDEYQGTIAILFF